MIRYLSDIMSDYLRIGTSALDERVRLARSDFQNNGSAGVIRKNLSPAPGSEFKAGRTEPILLLRSTALCIVSGDEHEEY